MQVLGCQAVILNHGSQGTVFVMNARSVMHGYMNEDHAELPASANTTATNNAAAIGLPLAPKITSIEADSASGAAAKSLGNVKLPWDN